MNAVIRFVCTGIWNASERSGIGLGWLAPYVFGGMMGARPRRTR